MERNEGNASTRQIMIFGFGFLVLVLILFCTARLDLVSKQIHETISACVLIGYFMVAISGMSVRGLRNKERKAHNGRR